MKSSDATATLGFHRDWAETLLGPDSPAVAFMDDLIQKSPGGRDERALQANSQVIHLLMTMHRRDQQHIAEVKARNVVAELY